MNSVSRAPVAVAEHVVRRDGGTRTAHAVLDALVAWGVRRIYCCPGSTEAAVLDALTTREDLRLVLVTHESVAVAMAEGEARVTGRPTVAYLHTNVGLANGLAHLSSAHLAYAPVVVLNGLKPSSLAGRRAFTSVDPRDMVREHVKWAHVSAEAAMLPGDVDRALHVATSEPAGPVWLGLPQDMLENRTAAADRTRTRPNREAPVRPAAAATAAAAELLATAERPVLVAGADLVRRFATDALVELAERLGAPILEEGRRDFVTSVVPTGHSLHRGRIDQATGRLDEADVVAYLGCRMFTEFEAPGLPGPSPHARTIHLHSDVAEVGRLHQVDISLVGDPAEALRDLLAALPSQVARPNAPAVSRRSDTHRPERRLPGHVGLDRVVAALADAVEATSATVVLDATTATGPLLNGLRTTRPGQLLGSTSGSLGWGIGAGLGAACADPATAVVCVIGDGAFQFGLPALWVARQLDAPITVVVLNNGMYAAVASALARFDGQAATLDRWPGTDIRGLDIAGAGAAFGIPSQRLTASDEALASVVLQAVRQRGPALLDIVTNESVTVA